MHATVVTPAGLRTSGFSGLGSFNPMTQTNPDPFQLDVKEVLQLFLDGKLPPDYPVHIRIKLAGDAANKRGGKSEREELRARLRLAGSVDTNLDGYKEWIATPFVARIPEMVTWNYILAVKLQDPSHLGLARQAAAYNVSRGRIPAPPAADYNLNDPATRALDARRARAAVSAGTWKEFRGQALAPTDPIRDLTEYLHGHPQVPEEPGAPSGGSKEPNTGSGQGQQPRRPQQPTNGGAPVQAGFGGMGVGLLLVAAGGIYYLVKRRRSE